MGVNLMDCEAYHLLLTGYLDQELSETEVQLLKAHLSVCEPCCATLKRMEAMATVLKRYKLLQAVPDAPPDFAQKVAARLQAVVRQEKIPFSVKVRGKARMFALRLVEQWAGSLRTRPFAWMTAAAVVMLFLAGSVFIDLWRTAYQAEPIRPATVALPPGMQVAQKKDEDNVVRKSLAKPVAPPSLAEAPQSRPPASAPAVPAAETPREITAQTAVADESFESGEAAAETVAEEEQMSALIEFSPAHTTQTVELAKASALPPSRFVKSGSDAVEGYINAHVIEMSQEQFDDAIFIGYVHPGSIE